MKIKKDEKKIDEQLDSQISSVFQLFYFLRLKVAYIKTSYNTNVIQSECGKIRTRITPNTTTFHVVLVSNATHVFPTKFIEASS